MHTLASLQRGLTSAVPGGTEPCLSLRVSPVYHFRLRRVTGEASSPYSSGLKKYTWKYNILFHVSRFKLEEHARAFNHELRVSKFNPNQTRRRLMEYL
jgi:hypothetical protein